MILGGRGNPNYPRTRPENRVVRGGIACKRAEDNRGKRVEGQIAERSGNGDEALARITA